MAKPEESAQIIVKGQSFHDWETVSVDCQFHTQARYCQFSVSEQVSKNATFASLQLKPGDKCEVYLAGIKVMTGFVFGRQAAFDATNHGVMISAMCKTGDLVSSSAPLKASQMRGYSFEPIARALLKPFGINLKMVNVPDYASKAFKDLNIWPGESVFQCLDRLARQRGMFIRSDADGNLVVGTGSTSPGASFVEGQNILSGTCSIRDDTLNDPIGVVGQQRGDDQTDGETARKPAAYATGDASRYKPRIILAEEPGDATDMSHRADHEQAWLLGKTIECNITVQGWLKPDGTVWDVEDCYTVSSPMLLLDNTTLGPTSVVFSQSNPNGTTTAISMVRPEARGRIGAVQKGETSGLPGGNPSQATAS